MKIALLISGGVDSAVACYQLVSHGYTPDLWYIKIGSDEDETLTCTAEEDIEMATAVARKYGLKLNIIDLHDVYWDKVVSYTMDTVKRGLTPNPDVMCNQFIKFGAFIDKVGHEYDRIATGHYATIYRGDMYETAKMETLDNFTQLTGKVWLGRAADPIKDQTDFLCTLNDYQMSKIMLPIGHLHKAQVRAIADEQHLAPAKRKDSQGICFLGKINYNEYIEHYLGKKEGNIRNYDDKDGAILGKHNGYWFYTIGQRKGLQLPGGPWYVVAKDIENNDVYVTRNQLNLDTMLIEFNRESERWFNDFGKDKIGNPYAWMEHVQVRIRHTSQPINGTLWMQFHNVKTEDYLHGVAPGQFVVIYSWDGRIVLGSAEIKI